MRVFAVVLLTACSFHNASSVDATTFDVTPVGDGPLVLHVAHVPSSVTAVFDATASLAITDATLDTGSTGIDPMLTITLPTGASLLTSAQDGGGPELAILETGDLTVSGTLAVRGSRPLVVIARSTIIVSGAIDGSAIKDVPGPGGYGPGVGSGMGASGVDDAASFDDSGGGGGAFGEVGGKGQTSGPCDGGTGGVAYGTPELMTLEGGSGGGAMSPACAARPAGAGGGAIQLYAGETITIDGAVRVNGGGGAGGMVCSGLGTGGSGGGSGGAIYLQTQGVVGSGLVLAQGGGGSGASNFNTSVEGGYGEDGAATIIAAKGGTGPGTGVGGEDNSGGNAGFRDARPETLVAISGSSFGNGGGGGGGVGRIVIRASAASVGTSPMGVMVAP